MMKLFIQLLTVLSSIGLVFSEVQAVSTDQISKTYATQLSSESGCYLQYFFLKVQPGLLPQCVDYPYNVSACGWIGNNDPKNLYNNNYNDENQFEVGIGIHDNLYNALTTTSFIQLTGAEKLPGVGISFQHLSDESKDFKVHVFGSNKVGVCDPPRFNDARDSTWLGTGTSTEFINLEPNYKKFEYLCANAQEDPALIGQQVLLSQIRFSCPDPSVKPSMMPTKVPTHKPSLKPTLKPSFVPTKKPSLAPITITPSDSPTVRPSAMPTLLPSVCHVHYYFLKLGELGQCIDNFFPTPPGVKLCAESDNGDSVILFNNNFGDDELEAGMGITTSNNADIDGYITPGYYMKLYGINILDDVNLMMHHVDGDATFAWYGVDFKPNSDDEVVIRKDLLVTGSTADNGAYLAPQGYVNGVLKTYKDYDALYITSTNGKVLLSMIRLACETPTVEPTTLPTLKPTHTPTIRPTAAPSHRPTKQPTAKPSTKKPSFIPTAFPSEMPTIQPTECHSQYFFFKLDIDYTSDEKCVSYPGDVKACAWDAWDNQLMLFNNNFDDYEDNNGLGIWNDKKAITCDNFIQLEGVDVLIRAGLNIHSTFQDACFTFYGTNTKGKISDPKTDKANIVGKSCVEEKFINLYFDDDGTYGPLDGEFADYRQFKYINIQADDCSYPVLLAEIRYYCLPPTASPTLAPTFNPTLNPSIAPSSLPSLEPTRVPNTFIPTIVPSLLPSFTPTHGPTGCYLQYLFLKVGLGVVYHAPKQLGYYGNTNVNLYGFKGTTPANLYSKDDEEVELLDYGMGFEDTESHELTPGYSIYIEGLNNLTKVELSMCALDNTANLFEWAWYGTNDLSGKNDFLLVTGDYSTNPKGWFFSVEGNGKSWLDFKYIKVVALKGQVLLASVRFECLTPTVAPTHMPTIWPSDKPVTIRPSFTPTVVPSVNPSLAPSHCHLQYYFAKLTIPTIGGHTVCQPLYSPNVTVCGFDLTGKGINLYSTYQDDIPELQQGLGFQNPDYVVGQSSRYVEINPDRYLLLKGTMFLEGVAFDMHGMSDGGDQFIFYGYNGDLTKGFSLDEIVTKGTVLGEGDDKNQGKFVALSDVYQTFEYVIITAKAGKMMLGEMRYDCLTPTSSPSFDPTFEPTVKPSKEPTLKPSKKPTVEPSLKPTSHKPTKQPSHTPTVKPSFFPTECHVQYVFLKVDINPLPSCQDHYAPGHTVGLCGFLNNEPASLWSNNLDDEVNAGMGITNVTGHAISTDSFIQLTDVTVLLDLAFDIHSTFGPTDYIIYASNKTGVPVTDPSAVVFVRNNEMGHYNYIPDGNEAKYGTTLDYKDYKYLFVTSADPNKNILLFEMRYRCSAPSISPTQSPFAPHKNPSKTPTVAPVRSTKSPASGVQVTTAPVIVSTKAPFVPPVKPSIKPTTKPTSTPVKSPVKPSSAPVRPPAKPTDQPHKHEDDPADPSTDTTATTVPTSASNSVGSANSVGTANTLESWQVGLIASVIAAVLLLVFAVAGYWRLQKRQLSMDDDLDAMESPRNPAPGSVSDTLNSKLTT